MKQIYYISLLSLCNACSLQHKIRHRQDRQETEQHATVHTDSLRIEQAVTRLYLSSKDKLIRTEVIPDGIFRYSPEEGFTGKATKVSIQQIQHHTQSVQDSMRLVLSHKELSRSEGNRQSRHQERDLVSKQKHPGWLVLFLTIGMALLLVFLLVRIKRRDD